MILQVSSHWLKIQIVDVELELMPILSSGLSQIFILKTNFMFAYVTVYSLLYNNRIFQNAFFTQRLKILIPRQTDFNLMRVSCRFQEKYRRMREDLAREHAEKLERMQKLSEEQRCCDIEKVFQSNFPDNFLVHSMLFVILAYYTHCIRPLMQVAFSSCLACPDLLSLFLFIPMLAATSACAQEQNLPASGVAEAHIGLFHW